MNPDELIASLETDIKKHQIELAKIETYLKKMEEIKHEENIKFNILQTNIDFLRYKSSVVSLREFGMVAKDKKKLEQEQLLMEQEIGKYQKTYQVHKKALKKMISQRDNLLRLNKKGVVLEFKRK